MTITTDRERAELDALAPELADGYVAALPRALDVVGRRLAGPNQSSVATAMAGTGAGDD